jgi:hypothetical protein
MIRTEAVTEIPLRFYSFCIFGSWRMLLACSSAMEPQPGHPAPVAPSRHLLDTA